jgi:hypothetical protein
MASKTAKAARASAERLYAAFTEHVAEQFCGGSRLLDDLPEEHIANDAELEELLAQAPRGETDKEGYNGSGVAPRKSDRVRQLREAFCTRKATSCSSLDGGPPEVLKRGLRKRRAR